MIVWIVLSVFIILVNILNQGVDTDEKRKRFLWIVGAAVAFVMALRGDHGGDVYDYRVYVSSFELIADTPWRGLFEVTRFEPGFVVLCKLLSYISANGQTIIVFQSFFCIYAVCRFIYQNTEQVFSGFFFFITLGFFGFMLTGLRQSIAIGILLLSVQWIKEKKLLQFAVFCLAAFLIHKSALAFVPAYFITNIKLLRQNRSLYIGLIACILLAAPKLIEYGAQLYEMDFVPVEAVFSLNGIVSVVIYTTAFAAQLFSRKRRSTVTLSLTGVGLALYLFRVFGGALERVALYYTPASVLSLSDIYSEANDRREGIVMRFIILMLCLILFWYRMGKADYGNYTLFFLQR